MFKKTVFVCPNRSYENKVPKGVSKIKMLISEAPPPSRFHLPTLFWAQIIGIKIRYYTAHTVKMNLIVTGEFRLQMLIFTDADSCRQLYGSKCLWICLTAASLWVKVAWLPCCIHAYTVYTSIGGKGRWCTRCDLQDHCTQARKSAGKRSTLDLKPVRKDTWSPKQEQSVAPQTGPWFKKKKLHGSYRCW